MRAVLDTSVLIGADPLEAGLTTAISTVSIAELHFRPQRRLRQLHAEAIAGAVAIAGIYPRLLLYGEDDSVANPRAIAHASCAWSPNVFEQPVVVVACVGEPRYPITRSA